MGGLLHTIKDVVTRQMIEGMAGHFVWRGIAVPIDPFLQGVIRYGKKIGFELPIIAPDNQFLLVEDAVYATDRVEVDRKVDWVDVGGYVTINHRELHRVSDVSDSTIVLTTTLLADHLAKTKVFHYSNPVQVEGAYVATQTIINVDVTYFLVRGDVICVSATATQDISFVEYAVTDLWYVGESGGLNQYQVVLNKPLHRSLTDGEVIQNEVYAVGKEHDFQPLRAWFAALYEVLLGQSQGPRFGSFAAIYGLDRTIALLEQDHREVEDMFEQFEQLDAFLVP